MFCLPIISFFKAIGDFRKTIGELKSSLVHLKEVFSSLLRISQGIEELTSEVKVVVEFYTNESKTTIRGQLNHLITPEASQELYYKDFYNYFRYLVNNELVRLAHDYGYDKRVLDVAMRVLGHLNETVARVMEMVSQDAQRVQVLNQIEDFIHQIQENLIKDFERNKESEQRAREENIYIKLFCEQQKLTHHFGQVLMSGLGVHMYNPDATNIAPVLEPGFIGGSTTMTDFHFEKEQLYRKRTTRIRELRHYLSSKIKLKKIGDYYREEISLQIQLDLKYASEILNTHEAPIHTTIKTWIQVLRQLPKHHFKEVFDDVKVSEAGNALEKIIEKEVAPELNNLIKDIDVPKTLKIMKRQIVKKGKKALTKFEERENDKKSKIILKGLKLVFSEDKKSPSVMEHILKDGHSNEGNNTGILADLQEKKDIVLSKLDKMDIERRAAELVQKKLESGTDVLIKKLQQFVRQIEIHLKGTLEKQDTPKISLLTSLQQVTQQFIKPSIGQNTNNHVLETGSELSDSFGLRKRNNLARDSKTADYQAPVLEDAEDESIEIELVKEKMNHKADAVVRVITELINHSIDNKDVFTDSMKETVEAKGNASDFKDLVENWFNEVGIATRKEISNLDQTESQRNVDFEDKDQYLSEYKKCQNVDLVPEDKVCRQVPSNQNVTFIDEHKIYPVSSRQDVDFVEKDEVCSKVTKDLSNKLYVDRETLEKDVRNLLRPLVEVALQGSSKLAVFAVDKSLFATSEIIEIGLTLLKSLRNATDEVKMIDDQSLWIGSLIRALPPPCQQDARKLFFLWKVVSERKDLRKEFMGKIQQRISDQIMEPSAHAVSLRLETYFVDWLQAFMSSSSS